ncbi:MAG: phosphoribosyltransferase [Thermoplasmata archaeon]
MFRDREDAGRRLAVALEEYRHPRTLILAIPRGGIPVGYRVAEHMEAELDVVIARKVPIPWDPEAGLGSVGPDGDLALNETLVSALGLSEEEIRTLAQVVLEEVRRREAVLRGDRPRPEIEARRIILVDDGLATGYTMVAAVRWVRKARPKELVVAVPCSSASALKVVKPLADAVVVLKVSHAPLFAVASFYAEWRDLRDEDVLPYIRRTHEKGYYLRR